MIQLFLPHVSEEAVQAVSEVLRSGWIGLGPRTKLFEERFAEFVGSKYAVAVNSATSALHLAVVAVGVGAGDEVLTSSLTFVSTNEVILYQRATPVFVDVDDGTLNLDLKKAEAVISPRTRAIIAVHYGGNPMVMTDLYDFASRHKIAVIEDAAHACGARFRDRRIGSFGLTCFSFHAVKNLCMGDGGMITTDDENLYERLKRLRWMGIDQSTFSRNEGGYKWEYDVTEIGYKYHMNDISAAIGLEHLKRVDEWNARRGEIVERYRAGLEDLRGSWLRFVERTPGGESANHLCVVRVPSRGEVVRFLEGREIGVGVHYKPNHLYAPFLAARRGDLSVTESAYPELMSLPLHLGLSDEDVDTVCESLHRAAEKYPRDSRRETITKHGS